MQARNESIQFRNHLTATTPIHIHRNGGLGILRDVVTGATDIRHPDAHQLFDLIVLALLNQPNAGETASRLEVVTFSDLPSRTVLERSLDKVGGRSSCVGREVAGRTWQNNNKIMLALDFLKETTSEYVMFSDGFDAVFIDHPDVLLDQFIATGRRGMISGERICYPKDYPREEEDRLGAKGPYPYGNSGAVIGRTETLIELYEKARLVAPSKEKPNDDQYKIRIAAAELEFVIDTRAELFQTLSAYTDGDCTVDIPSHFAMDKENFDFTAFLESESKSRKKLVSASVPRRLEPLSLLRAKAKRVFNRLRS